MPVLPSFQPVHNCIPQIHTRTLQDFLLYILFNFWDHFHFFWPSNYWATIVQIRSTRFSISREKHSHTSDSHFVEYTHCIFCALFSSAHVMKRPATKNPHIQKSNSAAHSFGIFVQADWGWVRTQKQASMLVNVSGWRRQPAMLDTQVFPTSGGHWKPRKISTSKYWEEVSVNSHAQTSVGVCRLRETSLGLFLHVFSGTCLMNNRELCTKQRHYNNEFCWLNSWEGFEVLKNHCFSKITL